MAATAFDATGVGFDADVGFDGDVVIPPPSAGFPDLKLEISETPPLEAASWVDISPYLCAFTVFDGKSGELDDIAAGTGTITLDNKDGVFDHDNASSAFHPYLTTNRRLRITATWTPTDYIVLDQFADVWPMDDDPTFEARKITVATTDAFGLLANLTITPARPFILDDADLGMLDAGNRLGGQPSFPASLSGIRIRDILELIGWPAELTDVDDGVTPVVADAPTDKVLPVLQQLARSEMGTLYGGQGGAVLTYRARRAWTHITEQNTSQATFTDNGTGEPYEDISIDPGSKALIKNQVTRTAKSGQTFTALDFDSQRNGTFEDSQTDLLTARFADLAGMCAYVLGRYKDGVPRITGVTVTGIIDPNVMFPLMLAATLGWRFTVGRTPKIGGPTVDRVCTVESVAHDVQAPIEWRTTWSLSEADLTAYFTLDDATLGVLDAANTLAF